MTTYLNTTDPAGRKPPWFGIGQFITREIKTEILDWYTRSAEILVQSMSEPNSHVRGIRNVIREDRKN